jgi:rhamnogalacturonan endolyase
VSGIAQGVPINFEAVLHWYNSAAQYWTKATNGNFTSPPMKPGRYTMKLYRGEHPIAEDQVTVTAGETTAKAIVSTEKAADVVWRIGDFDGQPFELKNGDKFLRMHPDDVRMGPWGGTYVVGKSGPKDFPMALFAKEGGVATVTFNLEASQVTNMMLKVGTTLSFKGGRPSVKINNWSGKDFGAPVRCFPSTGYERALTKNHIQKLIDSRGVTRGAYRGYGEQYSWDVPASALRAGENTLTVGVFGSGDQAFLSANYIVDAVELQGPRGPNSPVPYVY